jgi:hypothetical protein
MTDTTDAEITARAAALEEARKEFEPLVEKCAPDPFLLGLITAQMVTAHLCGYRSGRAREAARDTLDEAPAPHPSRRCQRRTPPELTAGGPPE